MLWMEGQDLLITLYGRCGISTGKLPSRPSFRGLENPLMPMESLLGVRMLVDLTG